MKFKKTLHLIKTDIVRYARENKLKLSFARKVSILLLPCVSSLTLYRLSHYFYTHKHFLISRFFWTLNILLFSSDIIPFSEIGEYFYMPHPCGIGFMAKMGKNCTVFAQVGIGGDASNVDIGAGKGTPVIGDNVIVGVGAKILGPIKVGNNVVIGAASLVRDSIPDNVVVVGVPAKVLKENLSQHENRG